MDYSSPLAKELVAKLNSGEVKLFEYGSLAFDDGCARFTLIDYRSSPIKHITIAVPPAILLRSTADEYIEEQILIAYEKLKGETNENDTKGTISNS